MRDACLKQLLGLKEVNIWQLLNFVIVIRKIWARISSTLGHFFFFFCFTLITDMEKYPFGICFAKTDLPFENFNEMKWQNLASEWSKIRYFWQMQRVSYVEEEKRILRKVNSRNNFETSKDIRQFVKIIIYDLNRPI